MEHPGDMNPDEPFALSGEPIFRVVGDEVFVLAEAGQVHWLKNATARLVWEVLAARPAGGVTPRALAVQIAAEFEVDEARAVVDVHAFLVEMQDRGLIAPVVAASAADGVTSSPASSTDVPTTVAPASPNGELIDSDPGQT